MTLLPLPVGAFLKPGVDGHLLGTDNVGRDLLSRILYGARVSLLVAFGGTVVAGIIGIILGLIAGYFGGIVDSVIMRIMDGMLAFPYILLAIILMTVLGSGIFNVILAIGIGNVPSFARVVRGEVHIIKNEEYCNAARVIGVSNTRMLLTHILPNIHFASDCLCHAGHRRRDHFRGCPELFGPGHQRTDGVLGQYSADRQELAEQLSLYCYLFRPVHFNHGAGL